MHQAEDTYPRVFEQAVRMKRSALPLAGGVKDRA